MPTVINNPPPQGGSNDGGSGATMFGWVILLIIVLVIIFYGIPRLRGLKNNDNKSNVDVHVNLPTKEPQSSGY